MDQEYHGVVTRSGKTLYYQHGYLHRDRGPAVVHEDGTEEWYLYDRRHSSYGPAVTNPDGTVQYYVYGEKIDNPDDYYFNCSIVIKWKTEAYLPTSYHPIVLEFMSSVHPKPEVINMRFSNCFRRDDDTWEMETEFVYPSKILVESALEDYWELADRGTWVDKSHFVVNCF